MANDLFFATVPSLVYLGIEIALVSFLFLRSWQRRLHHLAILASMFLADASALILNLIQFQVGSSIPESVKPFLGTVALGLRCIGSVLITVFTARTFFQNQASSFPSLLLVVVVISASIVCINIVHALTRLVDELVLHFINMPGIFCTVLLGFGWLSRASRSLVVQVASDKKIEPWIITRYKMLAILSITPIFTAIPTIFLIPALYSSDIATIMYMVMGILQGVFVIGSAIYWMMPVALKERWNKARALTIPGVIDPATRPYTVSQTLYLIDKLGELLSTRVKKGPSACKGLLYLSIQDELGEGGMSKLNIENLLVAIRGTVKRRLDLLNVLDTAGIVRVLEREAIRLQSIITVAGA